jgi:hypothetical protein
VVGVGVGDQPSAAKEFWGTNDSGTQGKAPPVVVVEETSDLVKKLSVYAFPTMVIIDREGKVTTYEVGVRGEAALRADLAKLGIGGQK